MVKMEIVFENGLAMKDLTKLNNIIEKNGGRAVLLKTVSLNKTEIVCRLTKKTIKTEHDKFTSSTLSNDIIYD